MAWLFVPGLADWNSGSSSPVPPTPHSVTWRGKPIQPRTWSRLWKEGGWIKHLSGTTFEPSTGRSGVEKWISSLPDSRVSHSHLQASDNTKPTNGTSGRTSPASSVNASQFSFSWRTSAYERLSSHGETFEDWASTCRIPSRVQPPSWVQAILGGECSFLPTATANHARWAQHDGKEGRTLAGMARWLPTPTTGHGNNQGGAAGRVGKKRESPDRLLATPGVDSFRTRSGDRKNEKGLKGQLFGTTSSSRGGVRKRDGRRGLRVDDQIGGQVNPAWKEGFMFFPYGWTEV